MKQAFLGVVLLGGLAAGGAAQAQVYQTDGLSPATDTPAVRPAPQRPAVAARPVRKPVVPKPKPITREFSLGFRLNTDGWSIFADRGAVKTEESGERANMFHDVSVLTADFSEHKHPKEYRSSVSSDPNGSAKSKPFIYGKINNFYTLKLGYARRRMIAGKPEPGAVSIHWLYGGGAAVGLLKPYYINAFTNNGEEAIKYDENTARYFLDDRAIVGGTSFTQGIGETQIVPGVYAKTGLHFDFAATKRNKLALETGVAAELYTRKVQLLATEAGVPYFVSLYAGLQIGRRYAGKQ